MEADDNDMAAAPTAIRIGSWPMDVELSSRPFSIRQFACKKRFSLVEMLIIVLLNNIMAKSAHTLDKAMAASSTLDKASFGKLPSTFANAPNATLSFRGIDCPVVQPQKKIVVFILFAADAANPLPPHLEKGVWENIKGYHFYFPDWICRFYVTKNMPAQFLEDLRNSLIPVEIVLIDEWGTLEETRLQRFLPFDDPGVSHVLSRDIDSRPSIRELLAVNEWLGSLNTFHTMRDHKQHAVAVMAGMFGWKAGALGDRKIVDMLHNFRNDPTHSHKNDQLFLEAYVWPIVRKDTLQHDGHPDKPWSKKLCKQSPGGCRPFPMSHGYSGFFVGQPFKSGIGGNVEQYHCFSTCSVTMDLECSCHTKTCGGMDVSLKGSGMWGRGEDWQFQHETSIEPSKDSVCLRQQPSRGDE
jgi:hypothetical protein